MTSRPWRRRIPGRSWPTYENGHRKSYQYQTTPASGAQPVSPGSGRRGACAGDRSSCADSVRKRRHLLAVTLGNIPELQTTTVTILLAASAAPRPPLGVERHITREQKPPPC